MKFFFKIIDKTALHIAVEKNRYEAVKVLLSNKDINVNAKSI